MTWKHPHQDADGTKLSVAAMSGGHSERPLQAGEVGQQEFHASQQREMPIFLRRNKPRQSMCWDPSTWKILWQRT